jgi:ligand-binding sensor domain-containing protein
LKIALALAVLFLAPATALAQPQTIPAPTRAFRSFSRGSGDTGLPASTVVALHTDREGTIWIATFDGVARVEHRDVERIAEGDNRPSSGPIFRIIDRRAGGIYVSGNQGLHAFDGRQWTLLKTPAEFIAIAEDGAGDITALDRRGTLYFKETSAAEWSEIHGVSDTYELRALASTADGHVIGAGAAGIVRLEGREIKSHTAAPSPLTTLLVAKNGRIWAGGEDGRLHSVTDAGAWQSFAIPNWDGGRIRAIAEDALGRIWAGADNGRAGFGNDTTPFERWTPESGLKASSITAITGDLTGGVWFGFNASGLQQWLGEAWTHRTFWREPGDVEAPITFSVRGTADGGFVAAVFNRGVWRWDGRTMAAYGREQGITEDVRFAVEPEPGVIWVGARFGIFEGRGGTFTRTLRVPTGFVSGIFRAPDGRWWATTTADGVFVRNGATWEPYTDLNTGLAKFSTNIRDILWRENGDVWIASGRDLIVFPPDVRQGGTVMTLPASVSQPTAMLERGNDVWVGGVGGIAIFNGTSWRTIGVDAGLPGRTVYSLAAAPDGSIWVGGASGVSHLVGNTWMLFDASNALISEECNTFGLLVQPSGEVLVGTMSGLADFHPAGPAPPPVPLQLFWRTPAMTDDGVVEVPADDRRLVLQWSAPWPRPVGVEYRTRIVDLSNAWSEPQTSSTLRVENLGAGTYTIQVAARFQRPGVAEWTEPITATVVVAPRLWETWPARIGALFLVVFAIAGLIRWRTARLAARARKLEIAVADALSSAKILRGLLPICAHCKKVRDDHGYWTRIEDFISQHSEADFSHGFCPDCVEKHYAELNMKDLD